MATINVYLNEPLRDGMEVKFKAPCDCTNVTDLTLHHPDNDGATGTKSVVLVDAHGNRLRGVGNLFLKGAYVKVLIDTTNGLAYIQNSDTNGYLEGKFSELLALNQDGGNGCFYRIVDGEIEWINPPMVVGTEYRTTERFAGKPVYATVTSVTIQGLGSGAVHAVPPSGRADMVIRFHAWTDTGIVIPTYLTSPDAPGYRYVIVTKVTAGSTAVPEGAIKCTYNSGKNAIDAAETWYIQLWYTKE